MELLGSIEIMLSEEHQIPSTYRNQKKKMIDQLLHMYNHINIYFISQTILHLPPFNTP